MANVRHLLTIVLAVTLLEASTVTAFNPLQYAFGSLQKAFKPVQRALSDPFSNGGDFHNGLTDSQTSTTTEAGIHDLIGGPTPSVKFNIDTFTFNRDNTRRVDDIFSLLADIEDDDRSRLPDEDFAAPKDTLAEVEEASSEPDEFKLPNDIGKNVLQVAKNMEGVLKVVQNMKDRVERQRNSSFVPSVSSNTSSFMDVLLDVPTLEGIRTAGLTAESEEEFLDHLTAVLLGAENRQHSALTLDPVTIIALLTLAAYLIRAVYQILTVTGRSLDVMDFGLPLSLSDLPDTMVSIHNWISSSEFDVARGGRAFEERDSALDIPGNIAAILKLQREGHHTCVKQFLCRQLRDKPFPSLTFSDLFFAGLGYYYGQKDLGLYIDNRQGQTDSQDSCDAISPSCSPGTLSDAHSLYSIFTDAVHKFFDLWATTHGRI